MKPGFKDMMSSEPTLDSDRLIFKEEGTLSKSPRMEDTSHKSKFSLHRAQAQNLGQRICLQEGICLFSKSFVPISNKFDCLNFINNDDYNEYEGYDGYVGNDLNSIIQSKDNNNNDFIDDFVCLNCISNDEI